LKLSVNEFTSTATQLDIYSQSTALSSDSIRSLNDRLMNVERNFISNRIFPGRVEPWYRHVIYAPQLLGGYDSVQFPGVVDSITELNLTEGVVQLQILVSLIRKASLTMTLSN